MNATRVALVVTIVVLASGALIPPQPPKLRGMKVQKILHPKPSLYLDDPDTAMLSRHFAQQFQEQGGEIDSDSKYLLILNVRQQGSVILVGMTIQTVQDLDAALDSYIYIGVALPDNLGQREEKIHEIAVHLIDQLAKGPPKRVEKVFY